MTKNRAAWLAWLLWLLGVALALFGLVKSLRAPGANLAPLAVLSTGLNASFTLVFAGVGALIISRQPRHTIGWLLMVIGLAFAIPDFGGGLAPAGAPTVSDLLQAWISGWSWWLLMGPLLLIILLFPTGRPPSPRWRWVMVSLAVCFVIFLLFSGLGQGIETADGTQILANPIGIFSDDVIFVLTLPWGLLLLANVVACVSAIVVRFRRAGPVERQQIKWLLLAGLFFLAAFGWSIYYNVLLSQANPPDLVSVVFDLAVLSIPLAIAVAIVRYRLWDIDVILRRTLIYAVLTALLAFAYFGSVLVLQSLFSALTGQAQSTLVTVLSTLAIAALFVPLRARVQAVIDRRLYRRKYDAARALAAFGAGLRDEVELAAVTEHLLSAVDEAMRPAQVDLWLRRDPAGRASQRNTAHD